MSQKYRTPYRKWGHLAAATVACYVLFTGCSSNNCPLESTVRCNIGFYDSEATAISYGDTITVRTLLPGNKSIYTYRKTGSTLITLEYRDTTLLKAGYTETVTEARRDTILVNKAVGKSSISLPMSYYNSADTLIFTYASISRKDTIEVSHDNYTHIELPECGAHYFHTITSIDYTEAAIDHIEINNPTVNYDGNENIRIYFNGVAQ